MDFKDQIRQLSARIPKIKGSIQTEEATKNALILPFIQALGYDVFDPTEVVPELDCDLVKKKGEKIDYAIQRDGETVMLVECKHCGQNLSLHETQLQRYFVASKAKFGVLTNGVEYRFYTDLVKPNIMDDAPFLSVDMENLRDGQIEELKKFHKSYFDLDTIISTASELKYMSELKSVIREEFLSPSEDLVRMFARRVYDGTVTQKVLGQFTGFVKKSMAGYINDVIADRLDLASSMADGGGAADAPPADPAPDAPLDGGDGPEPAVVTTEEELEGFYIVKSILHGVVAPERVFYRDRQNYFNILIDNNIKKTVCRLYFNNPGHWKVGFGTGIRDEERVGIDGLDGLWGLSDRLRESAARFVGE